MAHERKHPHLTDEEVRDLEWKDCSYNVLLRISSLWINGGNFGPIASTEAVVVKREDAFPEGLAFEDPTGEILPEI